MKLKTGKQEEKSKTESWFCENTSKISQFPATLKEKKAQIINIRYKRSIINTNLNFIKTYK